MTDWYIRKFKKDRDIDTDSNWPNHTGITVWVWGMYTLEEHRMGGRTPGETQAVLRKANAFPGYL